MECTDVVEQTKEFYSQLNSKNKGVARELKTSIFIS